MLICNRCSTSIPNGARFCPACGDPVTAGDAPGRHGAPSSESVKLDCPHCEGEALYAIPSHGVGELTCAACGDEFDTRVVRIRSKRSTGNKQMDTRSFTVRVEDLNGRDDLLEFVREPNEDFELRSKDLAAFSSIHGRLTTVQNLSIDRSMKLIVRPHAHAFVKPGCAAAILLWMSVAAGVGAVAF
jgi:transcription elongation factor Elf1